MLIHQAEINFSHEVSLDFILNEFQKEINKSLENNNLFDLYLVYEEYVESLLIIYDHADMVEYDFRKNVSLFISHKLVPKIYYQ